MDFDRTSFLTSLTSEDINLCYDVSFGVGEVVGDNYTCAEGHDHDGYSRVITLIFHTMDDQEVTCILPLDSPGARVILSTMMADMLAKELDKDEL